MGIFYVDGKYVEEGMATLPLTDMAILRGYAVFDFLRTYNGRPFHLDDHLLRLKNSAELLHIRYRWEHDEITNIVDELLERNNYREANLRFLITGGDSLDSITPLDQPRLIVMATPLHPFPQEWYSDGVKIITTDLTRYVPGSKSTNYIKAIMSLRRARSLDAIESIYVNDDNQLLEGTTSNLFVVIDGEVITPEEGILPGITRKVVIQIAKKEFSVQQRTVTMEMVGKSAEMFITSSNKEVVPVVLLDDLPISKEPGPITQRIMHMFRQYTNEWHEVRG